MADTTQKPDPGAYEGLRGLVFQGKLQRPDEDGVQTVLMDWRVANGVASVMAAIDGTASVYFSSGGGFLGGGQRYPAMREAAIAATQIATELLHLTRLTQSFDLPPSSQEVYFYLRSRTGVHRAIANMAQLAGGADPFTRLGNMMQQIVTIYREAFPAKAGPN
jgi:hypothetical protein